MTVMQTKKKNTTKKTRKQTSTVKEKKALHKPKIQEEEQNANAPGAENSEINDPDPTEDDTADVDVDTKGASLSTEKDELLALEDKAGDDLPTPSTNRLPAVGVRDSLSLYIREVSRFPLLKPEEEYELAVRVRDKNDPDAAFRLVSSHLRLVVRIAMDFQRRWMQNVLDLIQEGNVGLMRAVNKFDPEKGIKFSYYSSLWIKAYILKFIMDNWRMVKIGTTQVQRKLFYNLNKERQKLIMQGFDPDASMLAERLGVSEEHIIEMDQRLSASDFSLNTPIGEDSGGATHMDLQPALEPSIEEHLAAGQMADLLHSGLQTLMPQLNDKERYILQHRLLTDDPFTLREIGERYNITRERVRQIESRLLEKIRQHLSDGIKDFSDEWIQS
jgi:RNA polymerase sigma-32 factor